ncbi:MAG: hypothetical protein P8M53_13520 [Pirellulales bacterium]|nr:hypothetical protein [Pirellulales bacterium]
MRITPLIFTVLATLMLTGGCNSQQDANPSDSKPPVPLHIEAPGVDVQIGGGEGVEVNAPGADVEVNNEKK